MKLSFKFIKPWTWDCLKRKPKQVMIPVTAAAIAEALYADDDLYEQVTNDIEEMAMDDEEEEEEQESPLQGELVEDYAPDFESSVNLAMTGSHDTRTVREKFDGECG